MTEGEPVSALGTHVRSIAGKEGWSLMELESMFPGGIRKGARLLAGLPNPQSCNQ